VGVDGQLARLRRELGLPDINVVNVMKRYKDVTAIDRLNLNIRDGEYFTLLGPSGCGKTTLLRAIAGLIEPDEGEICMGGRLVSGLSPEERGIGFVFQHFEIFPFMTVLENVAYGPSIKGEDPDDAEKKVYEALKIVKLLDRSDAYPKDLGASGLQRCGIARALATGARLLLFDEPMGAMDPKIKREFRYELRKIVKDEGLTAVHVTHDQEEAMVISDRIAVMRRGKIMQVGTPLELYYQPNSIFVANFIGEIDFLDGFCMETGKKGCAVEIRGELLLNTCDQRWKKGDRLVVGIRRENFHLELGKRIGRNKLPGIVKRSVFVGPYVRHHINLENGYTVAVKEPSGMAHSLSPGIEVTASFRPEDALVFEYPENLIDEMALD